MRAGATSESGEQLLGHERTILHSHRSHAQYSALTPPDSRKYACPDGNSNKHDSYRHHLRAISRQVPALEARLRGARGDLVDGRAGRRRAIPRIPTEIELVRPR